MAAFDPDPVYESRLRRRFWDKVKKTVTCWLWISAKTPAGYGQVYYRGAPVYAAHVSATWAHGPRPDGWDVAHTCGRANCVRPEHLRYTPHATPMSAPRRRVSLTDRDVRALRTAAAKGASFNELALRFGCTVRYASLLAQGESRPSAGGPLVGPRPPGC